PGQPLASASREFFEGRLHHDLSDVRIHTDAHSIESARRVNVLAYTVGRDVVFGDGEYSVGTDTGRRLLAHELTHSLQQTQSLGNKDSSESAEIEADEMAERALAGSRVEPRVAVSPSLARQKRPAGTTGNLRAIPNWSYIVYDNEIRLRYYREAS